MNKRQRFYSVLKSKKCTSDPVFNPILMHFATRHLGKPYRDFLTDHRVLVASNLKCLEDFDMDSVGLISDPYRETSAFGAKIEFQEDNVPLCKDIRVKSISDLESLKSPDVYDSERTRDRIEGAKLLYKELKGDVPIIGWVEGPLAEACDLAGVSEVLLNVILDPDFVKRLNEKVLKTAKEFALAQIDAGCDIIGVGDAICSQISAEHYREFVKDLHVELFEFIQQNGARVKLHICGNTTHLLADIKDTNPDIVDIDHLVDLEEAYELLGEDIVRCGNLDPVSVIQNNTREEVAGKTSEICQKERGRPFMLSGGCEITVGTPEENLMAMREASRG